MRMLRLAAQELWHLFVDDKLFAAAIVAWPCIVWFVTCRWGLWHAAAPEILSVGMVVILILAALRFQPPGGSQ